MAESETGLSDLYVRKIKVKKCVYKTHPVYDLYAASEDGYVKNIDKQVPMRGVKNHAGYLSCMVRKFNAKSQKNYLVHRFVWECHKGLIPEGKVIDHINSDRHDNRLSNLQLLTQQENCKKAAKNRDYTFVAKNRKNKKCVKATNCSTGEVIHFKSMYAVQKHLSINAGIVKKVAENINNCKSGISKKNGQRYKFEYAKKEDLRDNYLLL